MKTILVTLFVCICSIASGTNYYFSSSAGNDSRSATEASNPLTPWKTLDKLHSFFRSFQPGDSVLFKRGDIFYGSLNISKSGASNLPITFGAYGTGLKPVISGFALANEWTNIANGVYETTAAISNLDIVNMVTIDGKQYAMGRYPNANTSNKGYLTIDSHVGSNSITDANLPASPNWVGAKIVIRTNHWILDTSTITSHTANTLTFKSPTSYEPKNGYGYFVEGHPATLDQFGEWYYNPTTKKLSVFFGSADPSLYTVKVSVVNNPLRCYDVDNIVLDNLNIQGANTWGMYFYSTSNITIKNCDVIFCGDKGINAPSNTFFTVENSYISDCGNFGIDLRTSRSNQIIRNSVIKNIGLFPGMGGTGTQQRTGIANNSGSNHIIEGNRVDSIGFAGIKFGGDYTIVQNNIVSNFTMTVDDGGGIYTGNSVGGEKFGRKILNNIVFNGIGSKEGTTNTKLQASNGIYVDDNSSGIEITGNSVWTCGKAGLYIHNSYKLTVTNNTFFNNTETQALLVHDNAIYPTLTNVIFKHNTCVAKKSSQDVAHFYTRNNDIRTFGTIDSNYYARPLDDNLTIEAITGLYQRTIQVIKRYSVGTWKAAYGHDAHTQKSPKIFPNLVTSEDSIKFAYNTTKLQQSAPLSESYIDIRRVKFSKAVNIQPYSSIVLLRDGVVADPNMNIPPEVKIITPINNESFSEPASITITAHAVDPDGNISKVEYYDGSNLIKTQITFPYSWVWTNTPAGTYKITARATDNSGSVTISDTITITVIQQEPPPKPPQKEKTHIRIGPNPVSTILYLFTDFEDTSLDLKISIYTMAGIKLKTIESNTSEQITETDVSSLVAGTYLLQCIAGDVMVSKLFLKQ